MKKLLALCIAVSFVLTGTSFASQKAPPIGCDKDTPHNCE